jgi:hypothetical protein
MKRFFLACALLFWAQATLALAPYINGDKLGAAADTSAQLAQIEKKLQAEGFTVLGRHTPKGLPGRASLVVSDPALLAALRTIGGSAVVGAGIRVGVRGEGLVSYMNPDYWYRAYLRGQFQSVQAAVKSAQTRLARALGDAGGFGGDVPEADLSDYRYMFGMERFDSSNSELATHASFEDALKAVQENLVKGLGGTSQVYQVVMPASKQAVFGVAMNDPSDGEGWWVNKIGADHMAGLPYELFVVDNKVYALYARYRIALAWPALGMGQFMGIINAPEAIRNTLMRLAGGSAQGK